MRWRDSCGAKKLTPARQQATLSSARLGQRFPVPKVCMQSSKWFKCGTNILWYGMVSHLCPRDRVQRGASLQYRRTPLAHRGSQHAQRLAPEVAEGGDLPAQSNRSTFKSHANGEKGEKGERYFADTPTVHTTKQGARPP